MIYNMKSKALIVFALVGVLNAMNGDTEGSWHTRAARHSSSGSKLHPELLTLDAKISNEEPENEVETLEVKVEGPKLCSHCGGNGKQDGDQETMLDNVCESCKGSGKEPKKMAKFKKAIVDYVFPSVCMGAGALLSILAFRDGLVDIKKHYDNAMDKSDGVIFVIGLLLFLLGFILITKNLFKGFQHNGLLVGGFISIGVISTGLAAASCICFMVQSTAKQSGDFSDQLTFQGGIVSDLMSAAWIVLAVAVVAMVIMKFACKKAPVPGLR